MDVLDHALDALLRWPAPQIRLSGSRRIHPPKRVAQEVELPFRYLAGSSLLLVDRELQLAHDLAQSLQGLFGFALSAQDHEVVGIRSRYVSRGFAPARASSIPARTGACTDSPAVVRSVNLAECRAACPGPRSCASSVLDHRFLQRRIPATS